MTVFGHPVGSVWSSCGVSAFHSLCCEVLMAPHSVHRWGAGIAQWLERRTRDRKVAGLNPCWSSRRIFFSMVDFLC